MHNMCSMLAFSLFMILETMCLVVDLMIILLWLNVTEFWEMDPNHTFIFKIIFNPHEQY